MEWNAISPDDFGTALLDTVQDWAAVKGLTLPNRNWIGYGRRLRQSVLNDPTTVEELADACKCLVQQLDCRGKHGRVPGLNYHAVGRWLFQRLQEGKSRAEVKAAMEAAQPAVPPMTYGDWAGNFMYSTARPHPAGGQFLGYFGPIQHAFGRDWTETYLTDQKDAGHTSILLEALDRYWGQHNHPAAWGKNFDAFQSQADRDHLGWTVTKARTLGLRPVIVIADRHYTLAWSLDRLISWARELAQEFRGQVEGYQLPWETDEPWGQHDHSTNWTDKLYEVNELKLIEAIHAEDDQASIAVQHAHGLRGSLAFYERAGPLNAVHFMQYNRAASDDDLRSETRIMAERAVQKGNGFCVFEHSAPAHVSQQPHTEGQRRHAVCLSAAQPFVSQLSRFGYFNG